MSERRGGRGTTLLELVVALLVSAVAIAGAYRVLLAVQRFVLLESGRLEVQQALRAASQVLAAEVRELDPQGGDIVAMGPDSLSIRAMRLLTVTCASPAPASGAVVVRDRLTYGYRAVDPGRDRALVLTGTGPGNGDEAWLDFAISGVEAGARCDDGAPGTRLTLVDDSGRVAALGAGSPVRTYERLVYRLYADETGAWWLGMRSWTGGSWAAISPVAGPLLRRTGLALSYEDTAGVATSDPARVASVGLTIRASSSALVERVGLAPARVMDSLRAVVAPRNGRRGYPP
jgi:type II secretory pathway pseudopilin PulG